MGSKKTDRNKRRALRIRLESEGLDSVAIASALATRAEEQRLRRDTGPPATYVHGERCGRSGRRICLLEDEALWLVQMWRSWGWYGSHWSCAACGWWHMRPVRP